MKYILSAALCLMSTWLLANDDILGLWYNGTKTGQVEIFKKGDAYFGKIVWLKEPKNAAGEEKTDVNNPKKDLQSTPLIGLEVLKDFEYEEDNSYESGSIYDPKNGKTYKCEMKLKGETLEVRGFIGFSLLGRTEIWTRKK